jgi:CheY-like chemotaxis protein
LRLVGDGLAPDLLVTDHLMPGLTGAELAHELRPARPNLPVLIVSGYAETEGMEPSLARLTKPFRNAELAASLSALLPDIEGSNGHEPRRGGVAPQDDVRFARPLPVGAF